MSWSVGETGHKTVETHKDGSHTSKIIPECLPAAWETNSDLAGDPSLCDWAHLPQDHPMVGSASPLSLHPLVGGALWKETQLSENKWQIEHTTMQKPVSGGTIKNTHRKINGFSFSTPFPLQQVTRQERVPLC